MIGGDGSVRRETRFQQTPNTSPESSKPATQPPAPPPPSAPKTAKSEPKFTSPRKPQKAADSFASSSHSRDTPPSSTFRESAEGQPSSTNHSSQNKQKSPDSASGKDENDDKIGLMREICKTM